MIKEAFKSRFKKGSFTRDVIIVSGGKAIVTLIGFLFIPVLSRIYDPEAYGDFSIYFAIVSLLALLYTLSYPSAFVIAKNDRTFYNLFSVGSVLLIGFTLITFFVLLFFGQSINQNTIQFDRKAYLLLIPLGIILNGGIELFIPWNIRQKNYVFSSTLGAGHNLLIRLFNILFGTIGNNIRYGLILGNQTGRFLALLAYMLKYIPQLKNNFRENVSLKNMIRAASDYRNYPLFFLPGRLVNLLRNQVAIYFIGAGFGKSVLGNFSLATSVLNIPIQILSNSLSAVFLKEANDLFMENPRQLPVFIHALLSRLFLVALLPFSILSAFGQELITFYLGDQWPLAGKMSIILGPYFFVFLTVSPVISVLQILNKERQFFVFNMTGLILNLIALTLGVFLDNIELLMIFYSACNIILYLIQCFYILKITGISYWKMFIGFFVIYPLLVLSLIYIKNIFLI